MNDWHHQSADEMIAELARHYREPSKKERDVLYGISDWEQQCMNPVQIVVHEWCDTTPLPTEETA